MHTCRARLEQAFALVMQTATEEAASAHLEHGDRGVSADGLVSQEHGKLDSILNAVHQQGFKLGPCPARRP